MERSEPTFVPQWLKAASGGLTGSSNSNHHVGSSLHSDDHAVGLLSRNRLSGSACDNDNPRSLAFTDRNTNSSFRRSASSNGSMSHDKDSSTHSRPYSSFGRSHRDRDREKDLDLHDRERSLPANNGYRDYSDSSVASRSEKDTLRRSQSMISGRRVEQFPKRSGCDTNNGIHFGGSIVSSIHKTSFERAFPSLGSEEKQGSPDVSRVSSPGLSTSVQSLALGTPKIGGDGWTSALAEVPAIIGGNGTLLPPIQQSAPVSLASTAPSTITGLNMAETLAQAPLRARTAPQLSVETQRLEELAIKQSRQLIPVTPSMPKASVLNSSEKLKPKGARSGDFNVLPRLGQQTSSQLVNHTPRGSARSDMSKASQVGKLQVLNRERNGICPSAKDGLTPTNASRVVKPLGVVPSAANTPLKSPNNLKPKADCKTPVIQNSFVERKPSSQARNRNDFFDSIRKKSPNNSTAIPESSSDSKSDGQSPVASTSVGCAAKINTASDSGLDCLMVNGIGVGGNCDASEEPERFSPHNGEHGQSPLASTSVGSEAKVNAASDSGFDCSMVNGNGVGGNCDASEEPERFPPHNGEHGQSPVASTSVGSEAKVNPASDSGLDCSMVNGNCVGGNCDASEEPERFPPHNGEQLSCSDPVVEPSEEEERFLVSMGWEKGAGEEALTAEEIDAFVKEYKKKRPSAERLQLKIGIPEGGSALS